MSISTFVRRFRVGAAAVTLTLAAGCGSLFAPSTPPPLSFSLDGARMENATASAAPAARSIAAPTLVVSRPHAAAGFDSQRMIYVREPQKLEHFARSQWIDTPAHMLAPLIVAAIDNQGAFRAVVPSASSVAGDLRLETEIVRLLQDFGAPASRVRFTLRAYVVDSATRQVVASHEFDESVAAASEDPYGGVVAASHAVQIVLGNLARFCADAAGTWQAAKADDLRRAEVGARKP